MNIRKIVKNISLGALCTSLALSTTGCGNKSESYSLSENHKVIIDTDTAADDSMALIMMAKAENVELLGVTVLAGNVSLEQGCKNALMSLEVAGRDDVSVYPGSDTSYAGDTINPYSVFGTDGMGDQGIINPKKSAQEENGVDFIIETVKANPGEVEILATGPLTNVAKAIEKDPETMKKVKRIWVMGTGGAAHLGNATPVAEFNSYNDVEACECVFDFDVPVTVAGYDVCGTDGVKVSQEDLNAMADEGDCGKFLSLALSSFVKDYADEDGCAYVCDPIAAASLIWSDFVKDSTFCHSEVICDQSAARGLVMFYKQGASYDMINSDYDYNIDVITELNSKDYLYNVYQLIK